MKFDRNKLKGGWSNEVGRVLQRGYPEGTSMASVDQIRRLVLYTDSVQKDDIVTKLFMRRKKLARIVGESGCILPELLDVSLYLEMVGFTDDALTTVFASFSDASKMTMARVLQKLRTMYNDRFRVDISKKKNTVALGMLASGEGRDEG